MSVVKRANQTHPSKKKKKAKTYNSGYSLVVTDPTTKSTDLRLVYGRADGMPISPQSMVVCDRHTLIWTYNGSENFDEPINATEKVRLTEHFAVKGPSW